MNAERVIKELQRKVKGVETQCSFSCTQCCQQPILMTYTEWRGIGRHPGKGLQLSQGCPFLLGSQCSIYHQRPLPCRWFGLADQGENYCGGITLESGPLPEAFVEDIRRRWTLLLYWQMGQFVTRQRRNQERMVWFQYCQTIPATQKILKRLETLGIKAPPAKTGVDHSRGALYAT